MIAIERRALYNLLRMNWLNEPTFSVEPWQVEDYRTLTLAHLFDRLKSFDIQVDRTSFIAYADECDSPEDLTDQLIGDRHFKAAQEDQIYLLIFELWRRLMSEKPSLSILCNELDYQIYLYDHHETENPLALQDALTHFVQILDQNVDEGIPPQQAFQLISAYCANDIEDFLYDFISEQIDEGSESYSQELLDDFDDYVADNKWFHLLRLRLFRKTHRQVAPKLIEQILEESSDTSDLDFNLELLSLIAETGDPNTFRLLLQRTLPLMTREEDFQDLLSITIDHFHCLDQNHQEIDLQAMIKKRSRRSLEDPIHPDDPDLLIFAHLFNL